MRVAVTGATGFLGSHVVKHLHAHGHTVLGIGREPNEITPEIEWLSVDFSEKMPESLHLSGVDCIIHLAQSRNYDLFPEMANEIFSVNVVSTQWLLAAAERYKVQQFIFASTGSVYEPYTGKIEETDSLNPTSYYACTKLAAESLVKAYATRRSVCILRLFFLYGAVQRGRLVSTLVKKVEERQAIDVYGDGDGLVFTPTHVDDAARIFVRALNEEWTGVYNVASPEETTIRGLASLIGSKAGIEPVFCPVGGSAPRIVPDLKRLFARYPDYRFLRHEQGIDELRSISKNKSGTGRS